MCTKNEFDNNEKIEMEIANDNIIDFDGDDEEETESDELAGPGPTSGDGAGLPGQGGNPPTPETA